MELSKPQYQIKVSPSTLLPKELGNAYTASLYCGLASLVFNKAAELEGKRILMFSYGSGCSATMFSIVVKKPLKKISERLNLKARLAARKVVSPVDFNNTLAGRAEKVGAFNYTPKDPLDTLFPGTYYLTKVDDKHRRFYARAEAAKL
jgi:hydroxymethylglutaryl-CoA synthase